MNVGDKVWVESMGGEWLKAVVVPQPEGVVAVRGKVFVCLENQPNAVYRVAKYEVKERND